MPQTPTADGWSAELGSWWRLVFGALLALVAIGGALAPLADPDLAIHLATGEWIARHRAVPFVEPFAWTRAGEPFYAYSWAIELAYFELWRATGSAGLQALHGLLLALAVASVALLGRVAGWRPWSAVLVAAAHLDLAIGVAPFLRPQMLLLILVPAAWTLTVILWRAPDLRAPLSRWSLAGLAAVGCASSNTHLLFPLTALPIVLVALSAPRVRAARTAALLAALVGGWFVSPYALVWPQMFAQNLGGNALLAFPSPIAEYKPGFTMLWNGNSLIPAAILTTLPWFLPARLSSQGAEPLTTHQRLWFGAAWVVGLIGFANATRAIAVWWLAVLPLVALAADQLPRVTASARLMRTALVSAFVALLAGKFALMGLDTRSIGAVGIRALPSVAGASVEPLVACLERGGRGHSTGRIFTVFDIGGYLTWRLPSYQRSIDGRTIFPDWVSRAEAYSGAYDPPRPLGPYAAADLAILPLTAPAAAALDTADGWVRIATTGRKRGRGVPAGLWVRRAWWGIDRRVPPVACSIAHP